MFGFFEVPQGKSECIHMSLSCRVSKSLDTTQWFDQVFAKDSYYLNIFKKKKHIEGSTELTACYRDKH